MRSRISMRAVLLVFLLIGGLILCLAFIISTNNQTPYDYLKKSNNDEVTAPSELLYQETMDTGISIVFYINQRGKYDCAIMEDAFIGYNTVGYSGSLDINDADTYLYGSFANNQKKQDICWGILVDDSITEVFLDNEPCAIVDVAYRDFRIFWLIGLWEDVPSLTTNLHS